MSSPRIDSSSRNHISKVQIKPLLRRVSRDVSPSTSIDLSRPSFEQEGLGIYTSYERDSFQNDLYTNFPPRRKLSDFHRRSTSGTSQLSTASSSNTSKPGSQYVHPMRLAPRAYTPPVPPHSSRNSYFECDGSQVAEAAEGDLPTQSTSDFNDQHVCASSGTKPRLSLHIQDTSFVPLPGASQTNVTGRASFSYSRDNGSTLDTTSPTSRSSLDFVFRSRTRTSMDPVSRAATVQAARQAFEAKEAAKTKKLEQQRMKAEEKQTKRKEKQENRASIKDSGMEEKGWEQHTSPDTSSRIKSEPSHSISQPTQNSETWKSQSKSTWMLFLTWLRTRIFKFRRNVRKLS
ncbi:hypothetical protein BJY04DRAFT_163639 [Aspergillus karnatakaensis]|uniref:uncharacterized protein n=1 Tax=Aspergillus karnatakaensis TaxID=1810916 RepID=UPI003CCE1F38